MASSGFVFLNGLKIGAGAPIRVESMIKTPLTEVSACIKECAGLAEAGCEIVRVALPDRGLADYFAEIVRESTIPVMADIHFSPALAIAALEAGCRAIRINPGNMDSRSSGLADIIKLAKETGSVIRIGANGGSLNNRQITEAGGDRAAALVAAVEEQLNILRSSDFDNVIISAKSSSVPETVRANFIIASKYPNPIHIGITEAGRGRSGIVKGAVGIGTMLAQGIGDTIRVSLTEPGVEEVKAGYHILRALELRKKGCNFISCPTCGRKRVDVAKLSEMVQGMLPPYIKDGTTIAVMGCEVNGPREAAGADLGIAGTPGGFVMFKRGVPVCSGAIGDLQKALNEHLASL